MLIGITGFLCAGKDEVTKILVNDYGFVKMSTGDEVRLEATKRGIEHTRPNLQKIGDQMRIENGGEYWIKRLLEKKISGKNYVFEGIRNPGEIDILKSGGNFLLIGLSADYEIRLKRAMAKKRGRLEDNISPEQFAIDDKNDRFGEVGRGQQTQKCYDLADVKIINNGTLEQLQLQITNLLNSYGLTLKR